MLDKRAVTLFPDVNLSPSRMTALLKAVTGTGATANKAGEIPLLVSDRFITIQGEAPFTGVPAIFIRLAGCNRGSKDPALGCAGCDTDFRVDKAQTILPSEMASFISAAMNPADNRIPPRLVVITGGEPLLQASGIFSVISEFFKSMPLETAESYRTRLADLRLHIQIESNGDAALINNLISARNEYLRSTALNTDSSTPVRSPQLTLDIVISPKMTAGKLTTLANLETYQCLISTGLPIMPYFRYVISGDSSSPYFDVPDELVQLVKDLYRFTHRFGPARASRLYLSPMTVHINHDDKPYSPHYRAIERAKKVAMRVGAGISLQTHVILDMP